MIWNVRHRKRLVVAVILSIFIYLSVPISYSAINTIIHDYRGIQQNNEISIFGRILEFNLPVDAGKSVAFYYNAMMTGRASHQKSPFRLFNSIDGNIYRNPHMIQELRRFDSLVLLNQLFPYFVQAMQYFPKLIADYTPLVVLPNVYFQYTYQLLNHMNTIYGQAKQLTWIMFILFPFAILLWAREKLIQHEIVVIYPLIVLFQSLLTVFIVCYDDYGRLSSPLTLVVYLGVVIWIGILRQIFKCRTDRDGVNKG
jgi:hypothetical protein